MDILFRKDAEGRAALLYSELKARLSDSEFKKIAKAHS